MMTTDFEIRHGQTVWLHGQPWRAGQERDLQATGFSREEKRIEARNGSVDYFRSDDVGDDVQATEGAITLAEMECVDLAIVSGSGKGGKIQQRDVEKYLEARDAEMREGATEKTE